MRKAKKRIVSLIVAIAVLSALGMPSLAAYESQEHTLSDVESPVFNTVGILTSECDTYEIYPTRTETMEIENNSFATVSQYDLVLRAGGGCQHNTGKDIAASATVTVTIYYDSMIQSNTHYYKLTSFSVDIQWSEPQVVLTGLKCLYGSTGISPNDGPIQSQQIKEYTFTISGHHYEHNAGFQYYTAREEAGFEMGCTATVTFQRGASSVWDFVVQCNY